MDDVQPALATADALIQLRRFGEAKQTLAPVIATQPSYRAWVLLASCEIEQGSLSAALAATAEAVSLSPDREDAYLLRSRALTLKRQHVEAIQAAEYGLRLAPDDWYCLVCLAEAYLGRRRRGDAVLAEQLAERALAFAPLQPRAFYTLARAQRARNRLAAAEASCRRALEIAPDYAPAQIMLGTMALDRLRLKEGSRIFSSVVRTAPSLPESGRVVAAARRVLLSRLVTKLVLMCALLVWVAARQTADKQGLWAIALLRPVTLALCLVVLVRTATRQARRLGVGSLRSLTRLEGLRPTLLYVAVALACAVGLAVVPSSSWPVGRVIVLLMVAACLIAGATRIVRIRRRPR